MEIKNIERKDYFKFSKLNAISFHLVNEKLVQPELLEEQFDKDYLQAQIPYGVNGNKYEKIGAYIGDKLLAGLNISPFSIRFDGNDCDMAGVGGVCSDPELRRSGAIRAMFMKAFESMKNGGQIFSYLHPFNALFYRKFGYELSVEKICWTIPLEFMPSASNIGIKHYEGTSDRRRILKKYILDTLGISIW